MVLLETTRNNGETLVLKQDGIDKIELVILGSCQAFGFFYAEFLEHTKTNNFVKTNN